MKQLDHPNVIRLYEIIDDPNSDKLYLIMPLAECGECIFWDYDKLCFKANPRLQASIMTK
jgi:[calcium/calmodulin-dependent protein kinase] kinase